MDTVQSSADNTDHEGDAFEDAQDSTEAATAPEPSQASKPSTQPHRLSSSDTESNITPETYAFNRETHLAEEQQISTIDDGGMAHKNVNGVVSIKSPLLTTHRMSITSSVDDVNLPTLRGDCSTPSTKTKSSPISEQQSNLQVHSTPAKPPSLPSRFQGFSASLPSVPWGPPPSKPMSLSTPGPAPAAQTRKITSPFAWLGRATTAPKENKSPPLPPRNLPVDRKNTAASISTVGSNSDLTLKALDDGNEASAATSSKAARMSLKDQFKILRMREEAGITAPDGLGSTEGGAIAGLIGRSTSLSVGIGSPTSVADEKDAGLVLSPATSASPMLPPNAPSAVNPSLAPGTVSGVAGSAHNASTPIDWDFWQSVVNEGPQVVARTSPEELAQAIASGIPQTIRGVIWQVLANSKNEDLEGVYRELVVRGTEKEYKDVTHAGFMPKVLSNGSVKEKESIASSSSSIHSEHSTPATSTNIGVTSPSPSQERDAEGMAKDQAQLTFQRQKRVKEDAVAVSKLEKMIKRDMGSRTSYSKYAAAAGFQDGLFNVCKAYALFDEAVGYPQGLNFVIMPLLFTMPEEEAFCLLVRMMNKYGLRELFVQDMPGLHLHLYQFERLLEDLEPALYCHLNRRGVSPKLYATQWFLTLFAYRFPLQLVMRVYDLVLSEGLEGAILKFGMALIQRNVQTLVSMQDMLALTNFLKERLFDVYIDQTPSSKSILESGFFGSSGGTDTEVYRADLVVQDACSVKVSSEDLNRYRVEWEEMTKTEKERQTELEQYRSTVAAQATKIRSLEERAETSDTEHVQIARDLVRLKVENQELYDGNESLRGQVEELKKVADSEAANVEARLKAEMDRVMQRNIEVQNENRHIEESLTEMEKELVEVKMKYAEINDNHETLKQKWNDLRKALD